MALVETPFKDRFKEELLEALRLTRGKLPAEEYKSRMEALRTSFLKKATGSSDHDRKLWSEEQQQAWGRNLGELRRFAVGGKFLVNGEDIGPEILGKLVGFYEAQLVEAVGVLSDATGTSVRSFSQAALRPLWERGVEVLEKASTSEKSEEENFLAGLGTEMTLISAIKVIGDWLRGKSENSTPDETARRLVEEAVARKKAEANRVTQPAPATPDPRSALEAEIVACETDLASATRSSAKAALEAELKDLRAKLAALPELAALVTPLAAAIAACEKSEPDSRLRKILSSYRSGAYEEDDGGNEKSFIRRVENILKKK